MKSNIDRISMTGEPAKSLSVKDAKTKNTNKESNKPCNPSNIYNGNDTNDIYNNNYDTTTTYVS